MTDRRTYSKVLALETFKERFEYLKLNGEVAHSTFGGSRHLNQALYKSREWKDFRNRMILRDQGCDLAVPGMEVVRGPILLHHITPITKYDILYRRPCVFDPENVICVSLDTHNQIHYGLGEFFDYVAREPDDTVPWIRHDGISISTYV